MQFSFSQRSTLILTLVLQLLLVSRQAAAAGQDVERWVQGELAEYVTKQLGDLPRFDDVSVRFVVFREGRPAADSDALSIGLRNRLQRRVAGAEGVRIAWQPDPHLSGKPRPDAGPGCEASDAEVLVGLEIRAVDRRNVRIGVRALDTIEQSWVPGFSLSWQGPLNKAQWQAYRRPMVDRGFLGERSVPYDLGETDLVARHIAHTLRCRLMRQVFGEYRIVRSDDPPSDALLEGVPGLVRNQLAEISSLRFVLSPDAANARIEESLHPIDGTLSQYWMTLVPTDPEAGLQPIGASVYLRAGGRPSERLTESHTGPHDGPALPSPGRNILQALRMVRLDGRTACEGRRPDPSSASWQGARADCAAIRIPTQRDAVIFVLNHQLNHGLVQVSDGACNGRPSAHVSRARESVVVTLPGSRPGSDWFEDTAWTAEPAANTYYAIAVADSQLSRDIGAHVAKLPQRCSESVRPGLDGDALVAWLNEFGRIVDQHAPDVDWRALRVREVY